MDSREACVDVDGTDPTPAVEVAVCDGPSVEPWVSVMSRCGAEIDPAMIALTSFAGGAALLFMLTVCRG